MGVPLLWIFVRESVSLPLLGLAALAAFAVAVGLLVKSALAKSTDASGTHLLDIRNEQSLREFAKHAADNLGRMYGIYRAMNAHAFALIDRIRALYQC